MLHDKDIREPLFDFLEEEYGKVRFIEEKNIGKSRADIIMITVDAVYGIEIKSDADTYVRLESQVKDYNRYCDYCFAAIGTSHAGHIFEHIPKWWGIITVEELENGLDFYIYRKPEKNPKSVLRNKLSILWRPELAHIQEINNLPKYKDKSKKTAADKVYEKTDHELLHAQISEELFQRDYTAINKQIAEFKKAESGSRKRKIKNKNITAGRAIIMKKCSSR